MKKLMLIVLGGFLSIGAYSCNPDILEKKVSLQPTHVSVRDDALGNITFKVGDLQDPYCANKTYQCTPEIDGQANPDFTGRVQDDGSISCTCWRDYVWVDVKWDGTEVTEEEWLAYVTAHFRGETGLDNLITFYDNGVKISADKIISGSRGGATVVGEIAEGISLVSDGLQWAEDNGYTLSEPSEGCKGVEPNRHCYTAYSFTR